MPTVSLQAAGIEIGHAGLRSELVHAGGGLVVLLTTTILAIYKPRGLTPVRKAQTEKPNVRPGFALFDLQPTSIRNRTSDLLDGASQL